MALELLNVVISGNGSVASSSSSSSHYASGVERGDLWKNKALSVQLRLRERFRVELDRRLKLHPIFTNDSYFSNQSFGHQGFVGARARPQED
ncbi:hypothetical protein CerSpe_055940 [Prunus speciosa]